MIWNAHEFAAGSWSTGPNNATGCLGMMWAQREANAMQAYFENLPVLRPSNNELYGTFAVGSLLDVFVLDTRIEGRTEPLTLADLSTDLTSQSDINATHIMSTTQREWFYAALSASKASWHIVVSPVVLGQIFLQDDVDLLLNTYGCDQWDGYEASRDDLFQYLEDNSINNIVFISGGMAASLVQNISPYPGLTASLAVEFAGPAVSGPNPVQTYGEATADSVFNTLEAIEPQLDFADAYHWGYVIMDVYNANTTATYMFIDTIDYNDNLEWVGHTAYTLSGYNCVSDPYTCPDNTNAASALTVAHIVLLIVAALVALVVL